MGVVCAGGSERKLSGQQLPPRPLAITDTNRRRKRRERRYYYYYYYYYYD
jgi:hypothetical protein